MCLGSFFERHERALVGADVVGRWSDNLAVRSLLDDMRAPARASGNHKQRSEHVGRDAQAVIRDGAEPVQIRQQPLFQPHHRLDSLGHLEQDALVGRDRHRTGDRLYDRTAGIAVGVDGVTETDDDGPVAQPVADVAVGVVGVAVALLDPERDFIRAAVFRPS